jgi:hypothetical protein
MPVDTILLGKRTRVRKAITLSPLSRLLLEREALARNTSLSRVVEELVETHCPRMIAEEQAAIGALTAELAEKRQAMQPSFKAAKRVTKKEVGTTS